MGGWVPHVPGEAEVGREAGMMRSGVVVLVFADLVCGGLFWGLAGFFFYVPCHCSRVFVFSDPIRIVAGFCFYHRPFSFSF